MVELLQFMAELTERQVQLAVIVSAWDLVWADDQTEWVEKRMLLSIAVHHGEPRFVLRQLYGCEH